jgi:hypothetical protein
MMEYKITPPIEIRLRKVASAKYKDNLAILMQVSLPENTKTNPDFFSIPRI